jgi:hypothetical protein
VQRKKPFDQMRSIDDQVRLNSVEGSPRRKEAHCTKLDTGRTLDHLSETSVFNRSVLALSIILGMSLAFTLLHTLQEWKGRGGPLWRNFGAIVGVRIPDWVGFPSFFLVLTFAQWLVSLVAITGNLLTRSVHPKYASGALGALIGARLGDTLVSHVLLNALGYQPNPGLRSTRFYVAEAIFLIATFSKGLTAGAGSARVGFCIGVAFFCSVLPLLWFLGLVIPSWRRVRWCPWEPLPAWTGIPE